MVELEIYVMLNLVTTLAYYGKQVFGSLRQVFFYSMVNISHSGRTLRISSLPGKYMVQDYDSEVEAVSVCIFSFTF